MTKMKKQYTRISRKQKLLLELESWGEVQGRAHLPPISHVTSHHKSGVFRNGTDFYYIYLRSGHSHQFVLRPAFACRPPLQFLFPSSSAKMAPTASFYCSFHLSLLILVFLLQMIASTGIYSGNFTSFFPPVS